jgi:Ca2+-binding EF-hand superfamily protein
MMKKMKFTKMAIALISAGFFTAAVAGEDAFMALDANEDGYISAQEAAADESLHQSWEITDANQDGQVDAAEFSAFEAMGSSDTSTESSSE